MMSRPLLVVVSAANLLANLLFPVLAIRALGSGPAADALFLVFVLPSVAMVLLGNSVLNWMAPRLVRRPDSASRRALVWSMLWTLLAGTGCFCLLFWGVATVVRPAFAAGGSYALATDILPLAFIAVLAGVVTAVAQSLYTAERAVLGSELRTLGANALAIVAWLAAGPVTLLACALLFTLRGVLVGAALLPRLGWLRAADFSDRDLREILAESRWLLLAATYYKSEPFVDRMLFAGVSEGAAAAFHLAQQILATVSQFMGRVVTATLVAPLSESVHAADGMRAGRLLRRALLQMTAVGLAVWLLFLLAGEPLVRMLLAGSAADPAQAVLAAQILVLLGGYMLAALLGQVLAQTLYTTGETRLLLWVSVINYTWGLIVKVLALYWFGVLGLAAALSVAWLLNLVLPVLYRPAIFGGKRRSGSVP